MTLATVLHLVRRWALLLVVGAGLGGGAGFLVFQQLTPVYEATVTLLVTPRSTTSGAVVDETVAGIQLVQTYAVAALTRSILTEAAQRVGLTTPLRELQQ